MYLCAHIPWKQIFYRRTPHELPVHFGERVMLCVVCCGVVWCGVMWCGVVCGGCGVVWCGVVFFFKETRDGVGWGCGGDGMGWDGVEHAPHGLCNSPLIFKSPTCIPPCCLLQFLWRKASTREANSGGALHGWTPVLDARS